MESLSKKAENTFKQIALFIIGLPVLGGILGAPIVLLYQCFFWLQKGYWESIHVIDIVEDIPNYFLIWVNSPNSWVGVSKIFNYLLFSAPLSGVLFFGSLGIMLCFSLYDCPPFSKRGD